LSECIVIGIMDSMSFRVCIVSKTSCQAEFCARCVWRRGQVKQYV